MIGTPEARFALRQQRYVRHAEQRDIARPTIHTLAQDVAQRLSSTLGPYPHPSITVPRDLLEQALLLANKVRAAGA